MFPLLPGTGFDAGHPSVPFEEKRIIRRGAPDALRFHTRARACLAAVAACPTGVTGTAGGRRLGLADQLAATRAPGGPTAAPAR
jgi:hypothetical protein